MGPDTTILPLLNGMRHLDRLDERFGADRVLGGLVLISSGLDPEGRILHFNDMHGIVFGGRDARSARAEAVAEAFAGARFNARQSGEILREMWEKWARRYFVWVTGGIGRPGFQRRAEGFGARESLSA